MGDGILECYESFGLGLHYSHVVVGGGGCRRGSGQHSLRRQCRMYDENKGGEDVRESSAWEAQHLVNGRNLKDGGGNQRRRNQRRC